MTTALTTRCYLVARPRNGADWPDDPRDFSNLEYRGVGNGIAVWGARPEHATHYDRLYGAVAGAVIHKDFRVVLADRVETPGAETIELIEGSMLDKTHECVIRVEGGFVDEYHNGVTLDQAIHFANVDEAVQWLGDRRIRWALSIHNIRRVASPATVTITPVEILR